MSTFEANKRNSNCTNIPLTFQISHYYYITQTAHQPAVRPLASPLATCHFTSVVDDLTWHPRQPNTIVTCQSNKFVACCSSNRRTDKWLPSACACLLLLVYAVCSCLVIFIIKPCYCCCCLYCFAISDWFFLIIHCYLPLTTSFKLVI